MADTMELRVITPERVVFSGQVEMVVARAVDGELGILPRHAPLVCVLRPGVLRAKQQRIELRMAVSGGFMQVRPDRVVILADAAERADEIDIARALAAKRRAEERLRSQRGDIDHARAKAALERAIARLRAAGEM